MSDNVIPIRPHLSFQPEYTMERERDKLLQVAELLEAEQFNYCVDHYWPACNHCDRVYRMTRKFRGMATRIRRFWGWAVRPVTDEQLSEMISDKLKVLNWSRKGTIPVLCDPMRDMHVAMELEKLRAENAELRSRLQTLEGKTSG